LLKRLALYITLFWSFTSQAQYLSVRGDFSIDQRRGCYDLLITVTNINPGTDVILYQYEGRSSPVTSNSTYTYTVAGNYWIYQYIQNGPVREDSVLVEILDPAIPQFELNDCGSNEVQVDIQDNYYDIYEINYGDGTIINVPVNSTPPNYSYGASTPVNVTVTGLFTTANNRCSAAIINFTPVNQVVPAQFTLIKVLDDQTLVIQYNLAPNTQTSLEIAVNNNSNFQLYKNIDQGTSSDTLINLQLTSATYCFRIASNDACSNLKAYSNTLCSIYADAQAVNNSIDLSWNTLYPSGFTSTDINRDGSLISSITTQTMSYADTSAICNTPYCYNIVVQHSNGSVSQSNQVCDTAFSSDKPTTVVDVSSLVTDSEIQWAWLTPINEQVQWYRVFNQSSVLIDTAFQNSLATAYSDEPDVCIKLDYTNICNNSSDISALFCPLELKRTIHEDGATGLSWQNYDGWQNGVRNYAMVIYDQNMNVLDSINVGLDTEYVDPLPDDNNQVNYYRVWAEANDLGPSLANSNLIRVERTAIIGIPSSFTPNGDNLNDVLVVSGKFIQSIELSILNRWGSTIYHVNGATWDGTSYGHKVPLGNYIYHVKIKDFAGNELIRTGSVLILKD